MANLGPRAGYQSTNATATTIAATQPSTIVDGDILIAAVAKNTTTAPTTVPAGWALVTAFGSFRAGFVAAGTVGGNIGTGWSGIYWKKAASESGTYTWGQAGSTTWNVQIMACATYKGVTPGAAMVDDYMFCGAKTVTRSTTVLTCPAHTVCDVPSDGVLMISQFVQCIVATTAVFSAVSGTLTTVANSSQSGVTQLVAFEYVDLTANPYALGTRQLTTNQASNSVGGDGILIADPSVLTGIPEEKRNDLPPGYGRGKVVN